MRHLIFCCICLNFHLLFAQSENVVLQLEAKEQGRSYLLPCPESYSGGDVQLNYYENLFQDTVNKIVTSKQNFNGTIKVNATCVWTKFTKSFFELEKEYQNGELVATQAKFYQYDLFGRRKDTINDPKSWGSFLRITRSNTKEIFRYDSEGKINYLDSAITLIENGQIREKNFSFDYLSSNNRLIFYQDEYLDGMKDGYFYEDLSQDTLHASIEMVYKKDTLISIGGKNIYFFHKGKVISITDFLKLPVDTIGIYYMSLDPYYSEFWKCNFVVVCLSNETESINKKVLQKIRKTHLSQ